MSLSADVQKRVSDFVLDLVQKESVNPKILCSGVKKVLENYVDSITDKRLIGVLYCQSYGVFGYNEKFIKFLSDTAKKWNRELYPEIVRFGRDCISKDDNANKMAYSKHVELEYGLDIIQNHVNVNANADRNCEILRCTLPFLSTTETFGSDNVPIYEWNMESFSDKCEDEVDNAIQSITERLSTLQSNEYKDIFKTKWMENRFCQACKLLTSEKGWRAKGFNLEEMVWYDPVKKTNETIDPERMDEVAEFVGLQEASDKYCKLGVVFLPANVPYSISDYDGKECVHEGSVLDKVTF